MVSATGVGEWQAYPGGFMGVVRSAPRRGTEHGRRTRAVATVAVLAVCVAACSSDVRDLGYAEVLGTNDATSDVVELTVEEPSPTPAPAATATPVPTPTALPTPTPVPEPIVPTDIIRKAIDDNFEVLDEVDARYTFAVHVDGLGYVEQRRPVLELRPASNQKVVTAVGALELLPTEFRFVTLLRMDEDRRLYVEAGGDPTLTQADIEAMIDEVAAHLATLPPLGGSQERLSPPLTGGDPEPTPGPPLEITDLIIDPTYFDDTRTAPGWPDRYVPADVGPMSALMIDNNQHRGDDEFVADPDQGNAELIAELLDEAGITVTGSVSVGEVDLAAEVIVEHESSPLRRLVSLILSISDNEVADALVRQIALDHAGTSSILDGKQVIYDRIEELGVDLGRVDGDGSGLSRLNRLSARQLVEVLIMARERPWWTTMKNGLANAGVDGTLRQRLEFSTTIGNVKAKTGTLVDVAALSGYLTTVDGGEVTFSLIIEAEDREDARDALDRIVVALASSTLPQLTG